jgi:RNA polymerase primary sigma factor
MSSAVAIAHMRGLAPAARDEHELVLAASGGDLAARDHLVQAFLPLIGSMARRYRNSGVERTELMQEGVVGLLRALQRYDRGSGAPFWPYASWWVRQAMQRLVAELARPVVLSDRALRQLARIKDAHREHMQARGMEPSRNELADRSGLSRRQIDSLVAIDRVPRRFEEPIDGHDEGAGTFGELLADPIAEHAYEDLETRDEIDGVRTLASDLSDRERAVLAARFGIGCHEHTLREIAARLGLSAERVRQIEERALEKLRDRAAPRYTDTSSDAA